MNTRYRWRGGEENAVTFGEPGWPVILALPPLFEEANRTRRVLIESLRILAAEYGIASFVPDLPGTGDSLVRTVDARWADWADAVTAASVHIGRPALVVSVRGGALLDHHANCPACWRLAPETGTKLLRDLIRASAVSGGQKMSELTDAAKRAPALLAGNLIHPELFASLDRASPMPGSDPVRIRTVRLDDGQEPADYRPAAIPVWRRAEPTDDPTLQSVIIDDILYWMSQCGAR